MFRRVTLAEPPLTGRSMVLIGRAGRRAVICPISARGDDGRAQVKLVLDAQTADARRMPRRGWRHEVDRQEVRELFEAVAGEVGRLLPVDFVHLGRYEPDGAIVSGTRESLREL
jgi:hypothetical protein